MLLDCLIMRLGLVKLLLFIKYLSAHQITVTIALMDTVYYRITLDNKTKITHKNVRPGQNSNPRPSGNLSYLKSISESDFKYYKIVKYA